MASGGDQGGSIRMPSSWCGIVGMKPTHGLVPYTGIMPIEVMVDHTGPMTRNVRDNALLLEVIAGCDGYDPRQFHEKQPGTQDYTTGIDAGIKGMRIGVLRHLYEDDVPTSPEVKAALDAAYDVLRGLGATVEDARIRPAVDYHAVKITGAESELYSVHEPVLRTRLNDFGADFLGRALGALFIGGADYMRSQRQRRLMIAEMAPLYAKYDVLITSGPGPAARLDSWRTINFWKNNSVTTPFNVTGGPALVQCIGFSSAGLPMAMQIVGRPFADGTVLRVAQAYETATTWKSRRPALDPNASFSTAQPPVPEPEKATISQVRRDEIAAICKRAGLTVPERHFEQLCATAPYVEEMVGHLERDLKFHDEPASIFQFAPGG